MPFVQINMIEGRTVEQKRKMVEKVTDALVETIHCSRDAVKIYITDMKKHDLGDGGKLKCDLEL